MAAACEDNSEFVVWIFQLWERCVKRNVTETDRHADKNTQTHTHSKNTQVHVGKLFSGFLCHLRYIGQLVYVVRSVKDTLDMTLMWHHFSIVTCGLATLKETCASVDLFVCHAFLKNAKTCIYDTVVVIVLRRGGWGEDGGWTPLSTLLWARVSCWRQMWILF